MKIEPMDGFAELMKELEHDAKIITSPQTVEAVTMAGADTIAPEVKSQAERQGISRVAKSVATEFDEEEQVGVVGWGGEMNAGRGNSAHGYMGPWYEFGTAERRTKGRSGKGKKKCAAHSTGVLRARPHMRPGYQNKRKQAGDAMINELKSRL